MSSSATAGPAIPSLDASNSTTNAQNQGNKPDAELYVAVVSLVIALIALLGTVMQVLQQYYASATGFANCDERIIGGWHVYKERRFKWRELRFEVRFKAPVIFVCPASNSKGPVKGEVVLIVDGSDNSQALTRTDCLKDSRGGDAQAGHQHGQQWLQQQIPVFPTFSRGLRRRRTSHTNARRSAGGSTELQLAEKRIHTADNERATWLTMLTEFQRMELDSKQWQQQEYDWHHNKNQLPNFTPPEFRDRQLAIAVQAKPRSWDTMPPNIKKPYATTTMCHLVEMVAMLGLHWKEFDRSRDKYRAEGNGYVLTGSHMSDLGVMFSFQISGKSKFQDNRIVPSNLVKEFAFGLVPTIFRTQEDERRLNFTAEEPRDQGFLLLGSINEVAETVAWFGCNTRTADILRDNSKKHGHLFPLAFEIVGMLSRTLYIPNTSFRMVPNPTVYTWDTKFFNLSKLLAEFTRLLNDNDMVMPWAQGVTIDALEHMNPLLRQAEDVCTALRRQQRDRGEQDFTLELCRALSSAIAFCDVYLAQFTKLVKVVLREHIQEILRIVNNEDETETPSANPESPGGAGGAGGQYQYRQSRVDQLSEAAPEQRHQVFMDIYFADVLPRVIRQAERNLERRDTTLHLRNHSTPLMPSSPVTSPSSPSPPTRSLTPEPKGEGLLSSPPLSSESSPSSSPPPATEQQPRPLERHLSNEDAFREQRWGRDRNNDRLRRLGPNLTNVRVTEIWCTLVFRMLCWLLLHDFHKNDRQVSSKSEVWGSRLPVYIG